MLPTWKTCFVAKNIYNLGSNQLFNFATNINDLCPVDDNIGCGNCLDDAISTPLNLFLYINKHFFIRLSNVPKVWLFLNATKPSVLGGGATW